MKILSESRWSCHGQCSLDLGWIKLILTIGLVIFRWENFSIIVIQLSYTVGAAMQELKIG